MIALQRAANIRDSWTVNGSQCHWHWLDAIDCQWRGCQVLSDCLNPDLPTLFWFVEKFQDSSRPYSKVAVWNLREGGSTEVLIIRQGCKKGSNIHCCQPIQRNVILWLLRRAELLGRQHIDDGASTFDWKIPSRRVCRFSNSSYCSIIWFHRYCQ